MLNGTNSARVHSKYHMYMDAVDGNHPLRMDVVKLNAIYERLDQNTVASRNDRRYRPCLQSGLPVY